MLRVRAVIIENDQVLTLERNKGDDHFWCFPGGGVEDGESEKEALKRECLEEANVMVKVGKKIYHQNFEGYGINFYLCEIISGKVGKGNGPEYQKGVDYSGTHQPVWLPIKDLGGYDLRPNELRDKIIKKRL